MVHPQHYRIAYAINPHMKTFDGQLQQVDSKKALIQWSEVLRAFEKSGLEVDVMDAHKEFPDMVFAANQGFPFWNPTTHAPEVLLSEMAHTERKGEVAHFESYFKAHDYKIHKTPKELFFEGTGDAILHPSLPLLFCGYGFRTHYSIPARLCELASTAVIPLKLKSEEFYHLDTCFAPLNEQTAVVAQEAFSDEGLELIEAAFQDVIYTDRKEASKTLAANLFCPDGKNVFIDIRNEKLISELKQKSFQVQGLETSEFLKAGGSVFCLKLHLW